MNRFDWKWYLKDIKQDKDITVFSTFSCGGELDGIQKGRLPSTGKC